MELTTILERAQTNKNDIRDKEVKIRANKHSIEECRNAQKNLAHRAVEYLLKNNAWSMLLRPKTTGFGSRDHRLSLKTMVREEVDGINLSGLSGVSITFNIAKHPTSVNFSNESVMITFTKSQDPADFKTIVPGGILIERVCAA